MYIVFVVFVDGIGFGLFGWLVNSVDRLLWFLFLYILSIINFDCFDVGVVCLFLVDWFVVLWFAFWFDVFCFRFRLCLCLWLVGCLVCDSNKLGFVLGVWICLDLNRVVRSLVLLNLVFVLYLVYEFWVCIWCWFGCLIWRGLLKCFGGNLSWLRQLNFVNFIRFVV